MKHHHSPPEQIPRTTGGSPQAADISAERAEFTPSPDEVSRRAYFSYVNQGSLPGHEVQHWLAAEAELIAERNLTRTHGFHHPPQNQIHPPHLKNIVL